MKLIHLSDLHLGKVLNGYSLKEDQNDILGKILQVIDREKPDGVMIAGDIYDKSDPSIEAVNQWDDFLYQLASRDLQIFVISGNHDSVDRLSCNGRLLEKSGVHISPKFGGEIRPITCRDEYGPVNFYLFPFVRPYSVRSTIAEQEEKDRITTYSDAVRYVVEHDMSVDPSERNVLIAHQFVTGAKKGGSEEASVGGVDNVDASVFDCFDYVALGHIHGPQHVGREAVRYCGTPLKYSFAEAGQEKSVTVVELREKGSVEVRTVPLTPLRDMVELRGTYEEVTVRDRWNDHDYVHVILTDEEDVPDAANRLRSFFPNLMVLEYERSGESVLPEYTEEDIARKSPLELLEEFYEGRNGQSMSEEQSRYAQRLIEKIWEGEE